MSGNNTQRFGIPQYRAVYIFICQWHNWATRGAKKNRAALRLAGLGEIGGAVSAIGDTAPPYRDAPRRSVKFRRS